MINQPEKPSMGRSRRRFLSNVTSVLGTAVSIIVSVPILGTVLSPLLRRATKARNDFRPVATLGELAIGIPKHVDIVDSAIDAWARQDRRIVGAAWLVKRSSGQVDAYTTICPHLGCSVDFNGRDKFSCPCHTSAFSLDGKVTGGPAPRGMDPLQVKIENETVYVRYLRFKQGHSQIEEA